MKTEKKGLPYKCWMCEQFPLARNEAIPPSPNSLAHCAVENGKRRAGSGVCERRGAKIDPKRIERAVVKKKVQKKTLSTPTKKGGTIEPHLKEAYSRSLQSTTKQGMVRVSRANLTKEELLALTKAGLIEFRKHGVTSRPFIVGAGQKEKELPSN